MKLSPKVGFAHPSIALWAHTPLKSLSPIYFTQPILVMQHSPKFGIFYFFYKNINVLPQIIMEINLAAKFNFKQMFDVTKAEGCLKLTMEAMTFFLSHFL